MRRKPTIMIPSSSVPEDLCDAKPSHPRLPSRPLSSSSSIRGSLRHRCPASSRCVVWVGLLLLLLIACTFTWWDGSEWLRSSTSSSSSSMALPQRSAYRTDREALCRHFAERVQNHSRRTTSQTLEEVEHVAGARRRGELLTVFVGDSTALQTFAMSLGTLSRCFDWATRRHPLYRGDRRAALAFTRSHREALHWLTQRRISEVLSRNVCAVPSPSGMAVVEGGSSPVITASSSATTKVNDLDVPAGLTVECVGAVPVLAATVWLHQPKQPQTQGAAPTTVTWRVLFAKALYAAHVPSVMHQAACGLAHSIPYSSTSSLAVGSLPTSLEHVPHRSVVTITHWMVSVGSWDLIRPTRKTSGISFQDDDEEEVGEEDTRDAWTPTERQDNDVGKRMRRRKSFYTASFQRSMEENFAAPLRRLLTQGQVGPDVSILSTCPIHSPVRLLVPPRPNCTAPKFVRGSSHKDDDATSAKKDDPYRRLGPQQCHEWVREGTWPVLQSVMQSLATSREDNAAPAAGSASVVPLDPLVWGPDAVCRMPDGSHLNANRELDISHIAARQRNALPVVEGVICRLMAQELTWLG